MEGEISNFKSHSSGHWYFTIKDEGAQLRAKCFRSANSRIRFRPTDGLHVRARGRLSVYEARGDYELIVEALDPVGAGTGECVLVVEDDAAVRTSTVEILRELGYRVLEAEDGARALAILESGVAVDLLFTDVVMPGPVSSRELAAKAKAGKPSLPVLFTSGYTENAIIHHGRLDEGVFLLSKPYRKEDLARKLRAVLAERNAAQPAPAGASLVRSE